MHITGKPSMVYPGKVTQAMNRENGILMTATACSSGRRGNHDRTMAKGYRIFRLDENMGLTTAFKEVES